MKKLWQRYADRVDALTVRERLLVFCAAVMVLIGLLYSSLIDSEVRKQARLSSAIAQKQAEAKAIEAQLTQVATSRARDPDKPQRERLQEVRAQLAEIEKQIGGEERKFTAPLQMRRVIEEMLARNRGVQLVAMRTLATTSIAEARAPAGSNATVKPPSAGERLIYRHGIEVTVSGAYLDLHRYLSELERLPTQLYWSSLDLEATNYPRHTLKLVVYTLSLDPAWLNV